MRTETANALTTDVCHCLRETANQALLAGKRWQFYRSQAVLGFSAIPRQAVAHERLPENPATPRRY